MGEFTLESAVEYSNILAVLLVVACFIIMATYIIRLQGDPMNYSSTVRVTRQAIPQTMLLVHNPFVLKLHDSQKASLKEGIKYTVTTQVPCIWQAFWGVSVNELHLALSFPWRTLQMLMNEGTLLAGSCISRTTKELWESCTEKLFELVPDTEISANDIGQLPRTNYPLAILMLQEADVVDDISPQSAVVGMLTVIHIKDSICGMETRVLAQYLKHANGATYSLKELYMASSDDSSRSENQEANSSEDERESSYSKSPLCVVCQINSVTRVLLPCRHACICRTCFKQIDKCPLCRSFICSYFCIQRETPEPPHAMTDPDIQPRTWTEWWDHVNHRLNNFLGFT